MIYSEYMSNKDCPAKNQMTMDWHCGTQSDQSIQDDTAKNNIAKNIIVIKKLIYKKDGRKGSHRCEGNIFIDLFAKKSKCGDIEQTGIIWNQEVHPTIQSNKQRIQNC
eukprot:346317_1